MKWIMFKFLFCWNICVRRVCSALKGLFKYSQWSDPSKHRILHIVGKFLVQARWRTSSSVAYFLPPQKAVKYLRVTVSVHFCYPCIPLRTRCSCCCCSPQRGSCTGLGCWQSQSLRNKSRCLSLIGFHAKLSCQQGSWTIWASEFTFGFGLSPV